MYIVWLGTGSSNEFVLLRLQLWESFVILLSDHSQLPAEIPLAAW